MRDVQGIIIGEIESLFQLGFIGRIRRGTFAVKAFRRYFLDADGTMVTGWKKIKGKKYYFRIRAFITINGTKYYSDWSKAKKAKIKK